MHAVANQSSGHWDSTWGTAFYLFQLSCVREGRMVGRFLAQGRVPDAVSEDSKLKRTRGRKYPLRM